MNKFSMSVKLFTSIALFLVVPLIIATLIINYFMVSYSENEISKSAMTNLKTIKNMNELLADSITKDIARLSLNSALDSLIDLKSYNSIIRDSDNIIKVNQVFNIIRQVVYSNYRLQSIYIYLDDSDYIIESKLGVVPLNNFEDKGWIPLYQEHKEKNTGSLWLAGRLPLDGSKSTDENRNSNTWTKNNSVVTFIYPLVPNSSKLNGAIVVNIYENEFTRLINNYDLSSKNGYVSIIDRKGNVVSHIDKTLVSTNISNKPYIEQVLKSENENGYVVDQLGKERHIITYYKSEFNDWVYLGVYSLDNLMEKANSLRNRIVSIIFALIFLGIVLSGITSRRLFSPLNKLVKDVKMRKGIDLTGAENEVALLSKAFATLARREDDLREMLEKNKETIEEKYLINLLKGDLENHAQSSAIVKEFSLPYFICIVLSIDKYDKFTEKYPHDQQYYLKVLILKVCEEIISASYKCGGVIYDTNKMVLIINTDQDNQAEVADILEKNLRRAQEEISKILDNKITIAVGGQHSDKQGITSSFEEAQEASKQRMVYGYGKIIFWKAVHSENNKYFYPYTIEKHILNNLNLGLRDETLAAVKEIVEEIRSRSYLSSDNILQVFIQLVGNTVKYLVDNNINLSDIFGTDYNVYKKLSTKETLDEIELWLTGFYSGILEYAKKSGNDNRSNVDSVFDFIHLNYNKDIDVTAIADHAGISYSYVRKIVKDKTGKTVVDYINGLRIDEAKRLLKQKNMNNLEIARQIGYNNDQSFNRIFKKYEGVTPGEFRNIDGKQ